MQLTCHGRQARGHFERRCAHRPCNASSPSHRWPPASAGTGGPLSAQMGDSPLDPAPTYAHTGYTIKQDIIVKITFLHDGYKTILYEQNLPSTLLAKVNFI